MPDTEKTIEPKPLDQHQPCSGLFARNSPEWEDFMFRVGIDGERADQRYKEIDLRTAADWGFKLALKLYCQND